MTMFLTCLYVVSVLTSAVAACFKMEEIKHDIQMKSIRRSGKEYSEGLLFFAVVSGIVIPTLTPVLNTIITVDVVYQLLKK